MTGDKQAAGLLPVESCRGRISQVGSVEEGAGPAARSPLEARHLRTPGPQPWAAVHTELGRVAPCGCAGWALPTGLQVIRADDLPA